MTSAEIEREGVREAVALCGRARVRVRLRAPPEPDAVAELGRDPLELVAAARAARLARARAWKRGLRGRPPPKEGAGEPEPMVLRTA